MLQEAATCSTAALPVISLVGSSIEVDTRFGQSGSKYTSASANQVRGNFNAIAAKFSATTVNSFPSTSRDRNVGRKKAYCYGWKTDRDDLGKHLWPNTFASRVSIVWLFCFKQQPSNLPFSILSRCKEAFCHDSRSDLFSSLYCSLLRNKRKIFVFTLVHFCNFIATTVPSKVRMRSTTTRSRAQWNLSRPLATFQM